MPKAEVNIQSLRVRSGPGTNFAVVGAVKQGDVLDVLETQGDWLKIRFGDGSAFVAAQYVTVKATPVVAGFLIERPELLSLPLAPERLIPTDGLAGAEVAVARTWNDYGNLLASVSNLLDIPLSAVVAVLVAESSGRVFAADGRIVVRFEVHLFHRYWGQKNSARFSQHFRFDTSAPANNWKGHQWRPDDKTDWQNIHVNQDREWNVLTFARKLDDTAALYSTSLGAPQMLGANHKRIGYLTVQPMLEAFSRGAHAQLLALFDFVKGAAGTSAAIDALRARDYLAFARFYNGPANAPTYQGIIQARADIFERLLARATAKPTLLIVTADSLNVRSEAAIKPGNIIEKLRKDEAVTLLEPREAALAKMTQGEKGGQWLKVRTDEGREGFVAAWLVALRPGQ